MPASLVGLTIYQKACEGKRYHFTMESAKREARHMHKKWHKKFDAYRCVFCGKYHVGTRRKAFPRGGE